MTRTQFSKATGVSISALRFYEEQGLLTPERTGEGVSNNRRLYSDADLERMQEILIYLKLGMPIKGISAKVNSPDHDPSAAYDEAVSILSQRIEHLENLKVMAVVAKAMGTTIFDFASFDDDEIDDFGRQMRNSPLARKGFEWGRNLSPEETKWKLYLLRGLLLRFADLAESLDVAIREISLDTFGSLIELAEELIALSHPIISWNYPETIPLYSMTLMMADGAIAKKIDEFAGEHVAEIIGIGLMFAWYAKAGARLEPYLTGLCDSSVSDSRRQELLTGLMDAVSECIVSPETQELLRRKGGQEDVIEYITGILSIAADWHEDYFAECLSQLNGAAYPLKETYSAAIAALHEYSLGQEDEAMK